jgi:hypothetical protein
MTDTAHYIILVDGEEFIKLPGNVWDGKKTFQECHEARREIGWKTLTLWVYRPQHGVYTTDALAQVGGW